MKKLLRKKVLIPLAVVAVMAIAATAAYAWWTTTATSGPNNISTGDAALTFGGLPISAAGLVPQDTLLDVPYDFAAPAGYKESYFYVQNTGNTPLHFVGWLAGGTEDYALLGPAVHVKITIAPTVANGSPWNPTGSLSAVGGPYLVYNGPIGGLYGKDLGSTELTTLGHAPLAAGQYAFYRVVTWLDGPSCDDNSKTKSMTCTLTFESVL